MVPSSTSPRRLMYQIRHRVSHEVVGRVHWETAQHRAHARREGGRPAEFLTIPYEVVDRVDDGGVVVIDGSRGLEPSDADALAGSAVS